MSSRWDFFRSVNVKDLEREMESGRSRKFHERTEWQSAPDDETKPGDDDVKVELPPVKPRPSSLLEMNRQPIPDKKKQKRRAFRVTSGFVPGIALTASKEESRAENFWAAKEQVFVRALEESGFRRVETFDADARSARLRDTFKWKISVKASTSYETVVVLDSEQVSVKSLILSFESWVASGFG